MDFVLSVVLTALALSCVCFYLNRRAEAKIEAQARAWRQSLDEQQRRLNDHYAAVAQRYANVVGIDNAGNVVLSVPGVPDATAAANTETINRTRQMSGTFMMTGITVHSSGYFDYAWGTATAPLMFSGNRHLSGEWTPYHPPKDNPHPFVIGAPDNEPLDIPYTPPRRKNKHVGSAY